MDRVVLRSPAKLNLYLAVLGKRPDGYHRIETVFERINLCDRVVLIKSASGIKVRSDNTDLPTDGRNLAYKAARLLFEKTGLGKRKEGLRGVAIEIKKKIPISAGLGGGSSNAASVLLGLNRLYNLGLGQRELLGLAGKLGADVAFFIHGHPFAKGSSRGDVITNIRSRFKLWHILIMPPFGISAKSVYTSLDCSVMTRKRSAQGLVETLASKDLTALAGLLYNSLEEVVLARRPEIRRVKEELLDIGVKGALVSGSGPAVFGLTKTRKEAMAVKKALAKNVLADKSEWQVYVVHTA